MAHTPDQCDRQIITLLQQDGRLSNVEIARSLGLAEGTIRHRLEKLLGNGVIRIRAVVDPVRVGLPASVLVGIQTEPGQLNEVAQQLAALPEVYCVSIVTGTNDVMTEAVLPSSEHLLSFLIDRISNIPGVKRTETSHVLQVVKRSCDWTLPESTAGRAGDERLATPPAKQVVPGAIVVS
jgi:Lrp/AsnC family transcriptional regulator for asnA, asnC and gidA